MNTTATKIFCFTALMCALLAPRNLWAEEGEERGIVLESYVGSRPSDANFLLAPLFEELSQLGFPSSAVAATRIRSQHSMSSALLSAKQIENAKRAINEGHAAYIDFQFSGAVESTNRGLKILLSRPATMARQQQVREYMYKALITQSMAHSRLGANEALESTMSEFIRSFPKREISRREFGPEGAELYRKMIRKMNKLKKGELQIVANDGALVFINEQHHGVGSMTTQLFPGRYRVYVQNGSQAGRVHVVEVFSERKQTLVLDPVIDKSLRTESNFVGLVFESEEERRKHEDRIAVSLGRALDTRSVLLIGFRQRGEQNYIVASTVLTDDGSGGISAGVPYRSSAPPSPEALRSLANFIVGKGPAKAGIKVLTNKKNSNSDDSKQIASSDMGGIDVEKNSQNSSRGISPAWKYVAWAGGVAGIAAGAYLISIDGEGTCAQASCQNNYQTLGGGIGALAGGVAVGALGFWLWGQEADDKDAALAFIPSKDGVRASFSWKF